MVNRMADGDGRAGGGAEMHVCASPLKALERLPGVCGIKMFMGSSTGSLLVADDENVGRVLSSGTRRVTVS